MERAHAQLLCRLAFRARERGLDVWVSQAYGAALHQHCSPCPAFLNDIVLDKRCPGLPGQLARVGMLWLDGKRVVCRLEAAGKLPSGFPGPDRVRCLALVDSREHGDPLRRHGWAVILSDHLDRYLADSGTPSLASRPAQEAHAEVVAIEPRGADAYRLTLASADIAAAARPAQFVLLECVGREERKALGRARNRRWDRAAGFAVDPKLPLLRRPFGIHRFAGPDYEPERLCEQLPFAPELASVIEPGRGATFEVLFKVVGRGTQRLAQMRPGEKLSARGPLGRPVEIRRELATAVLVAGGIGAGPLFAVAQELRRQGRTVKVMLGAADRGSAPIPPQEFERIGAQAALVTEKEDGLLVTQHLERHLPELAADAAEIFACGPVGMLREIARMAPPAIAVQVLMEQRMACGMGVCRGCVVRMKSERGEPVYRTVCRDGPAFRAEEVAWSEIAATAG